MFTHKYKNILLETHKIGNPVTSETGIVTREFINKSFVFDFPRYRYPLPEIHKFNIAFAIAEWLSYMLGIDDLKYFTTYIKKYEDWSSDGATLDGAYGPRLNVPTNQLLTVIDALRNNPSSRRAVVSIYRGSTDLLGGGGLNTPCTLTMQFVLRNNYLHAIANMRSNDAVWGLPYDLFCFTMIQEFIAANLGCSLGRYHHNAGSFHLYERHFEKVEKLKEVKNYMPGDNPGTSMGVMPVNLSYDELHKLYKIYANPYTYDFYTLTCELPEYLQDFAFVARAFVYRNRNTITGEEHVDGIAAFNNIKSEALKVILEPWMSN